METRVRPGDGSVGIEMSAHRRPGRHWNDRGMEALETIASVVALERSIDETGERLRMHTRERARLGG